MASGSAAFPTAADPKVIVSHSLPPRHLDAFTRAVRNIIATEVAELTYAQLIDGLPTAEVAVDDASRILPEDHPVRQHKVICPGAVERARQFRDSFDPAYLTLDAALLASFRSSSPGSRQFNVELIELAAVAVHEIAVQLFQMQSMYHHSDGIASWAPTNDEFAHFEFVDGWPTLFSHAWFVDFEQYPNGVADVAGYWAESRIFGGVVVFDRREPTECYEAQPDSVWIHPCRDGGTYRLVRLLEQQKFLLLQFLTSESPDLSVLPIRVTTRNTTREDPEEALEDTGIFRDIWERKSMDADSIDGRARDSWNEIDYPTLSDWERAMYRALAWDYRRSQLS